MKNTIKTAAVIALSLFAAACAKETKIESPAEGQKLHFTINTAENAVVKSFLDNNDGTYTPKWSKDDELAIFVGAIGENTKPTGVLSNVNGTGTLAKFEGTVTGIEGSGAFKSFTPASAFAISYNSGNVGITLSGSQKPSSLTIDEACDILVAKEASYTADAANNVVVNDLFFKRMFSVVKVALTGPTALNGEKVQKFSLTAPEGTVLAGRAAINLSTATIEKWNIENNTVTATYTTDAPVFGSDTPGLGNVVWLVVNPGTIASGAKVTFAGETAGYTFSKEVTLSKDIVFPESQIAVINLKLNEDNLILKSQPLLVEFPNLGFKTWGESAIFSGTTKESVGQEKDGVKILYERHGSSLYANQSAIRFYKNNTLQFTAPEGFSIVGIEFGGSGFMNDVTSDDDTIISTDKALSWKGSASSVTFTRPENASGYITLSSVKVSLQEGLPLTKYWINIEYPDEKLGSISASAQRAIEGTEISLTAAPKEGYEFAGWTVLGTDNTTIAVSDDKFTMPAQDVFISASFNLIDYSITKNVSDNGSFIVKKLDGSEVTTAHKGDVITLWATPDEGYVFNEWIIKDDAGMSVSVNYNKFTMPASNVTISASFKLKPVVTYEHAGTAEDPYNIADVIKLISTLGTEISSEVYAKGIIRSIKEVSTNYGNATYSIGDDSSSEVIDVFRGKYLNGTKFTSNDQIQVEDEVVVKGKVQDYKGAKQFCVNNQIVSLKRIEPCATPVITIAEDGAVSIACETAGATIHYTVGENPADPTEADAVFSAVTLTDGQTIKAIAVAEGFKPSAVASKKYTVGGTTSYFVKVTTAPTDWSGTYLIVYETGNVAFDGSLTTLDAVSNTVDVTISDNKIEATDALMKSVFVIDGKAGSLKSSSGYYVGYTGTKNGMNTNQKTVYKNVFEFDAKTKVITIKSKNSYLKYNSASNQTRFRYFASGQQDIQLYKLDN